LPVWLFASGSSPEMFRLAGEIGAGILIEPVTAGFESVAERIKLYRQVWRDHGHGPGLSTASGRLVRTVPGAVATGGTGHAVLILPTSDLEGIPESRLSIIARLGSIDVDEVACLLDFRADQKSVLDGLRNLEALREASTGCEGKKADVPGFWEPPGDAAPIEQTDSIPAEEIRERAQTRRAMLRRNTGLRKN